MLDGNACAASLLAKAVHQEIHMPPDSRLDNLSVEVDFDSLGIWIDPIGKFSVYWTRNYMEIPGVSWQKQKGCIIVGSF